MEDTFTPDPEPEAFDKRQSVRCPYCNDKMPVEQTMQCECGAVFDFLLKEKCGPESYE